LSSKNYYVEEEEELEKNETSLQEVLDGLESKRN
jgi:hypothetical protein